MTELGVTAATFERKRRQWRQQWQQQQCRDLRIGEQHAGPSAVRTMGVTPSLDHIFDGAGGQGQEEAAGSQDGRLL